jgi:hypothetical protein
MRFSIASLLALTTLVAAGVAVFPHVAYELSLSTSVERFNAAMDATDFDEAERQARWAVWFHPGNPEAENMLWQGRFACRLRDAINEREHAPGDAPRERHYCGLSLHP